MSDTINYDQEVKDLIAGLDATGHVTHIAYKKKSVTLHHNGGRLSHEGVLRVWETRPASAHFDVDAYGKVAQYVRQQEYAWAVGNKTGNQETISIEMCNATLAPQWLVSEITWKNAARLAGWLFAKVIDGRPMPSSSNLFYHHRWKPTECAGPYMDSVYDKVLAETKVWYSYFIKGGEVPPANVTISTRAAILGYGGGAMNLVDSFFADCNSILAWGGALKLQPVNPVSRQAWVSKIANKDFDGAGVLFRACISNLQDYFGIQEDVGHVLHLLYRMKPYGYQIISYDGKVL